MPEGAGTPDHPIEAERLLADLPACLGVRRWVDEVVAGAPFGSADDVIAAVEESRLTPADIEEALSHHPRIGERPEGHSAAHAFSRREQASPDADDQILAAALAEGNRAYEERFGRVFLIRAAGRSRAEILAELHRRLGLGDEEELAVVAQQLRQIAVLRVRAIFAGTAEQEETL